MLPITNNQYIFDCWLWVTLTLYRHNPWYRLVQQRRGMLLIRTVGLGERQQAGQRRARGAALPARHVLRAGLGHQLHVVGAEHLALVPVHRFRLVLAPAPDAALVSGGGE